jgi:hypothetical protein
MKQIKMVKEALLTVTLTAGLSLLFASSILSEFAHAEGGNRPMIEIGGGAQSEPKSDRMRGLIRLTYGGIKNNPACGRCDENWQGCSDEYYFSFSAQVGLSSEGTLSSMDIRVAPVQGYEYRLTADRNDPNRKVDLLIEGATLPILATREIALGNEAKLRVDLLGASVTSFGDANDLNQFFVNVSANLAGFQYLRASGYEEGSQNRSESFKGFDVGDAGVSVGATQSWSKGFRTRITLGAKGEFAAGKSNMRSWTTSAQAREFARVSAILESKRLQLEAYLQGSATQMAVGEDTKSVVQVEFGTLTRF